MVIVSFPLYVQIDVPKDTLCQKCNEVPFKDPHHLIYQITPEDLKIPIEKIVQLLCRNCHNEEHPPKEEPFLIQPVLEHPDVNQREQEALEAFEGAHPELERPDVGYSAWLETLEEYVNKPEWWLNS